RSQLCRNHRVKTSSSSAHRRPFAPQFKVAPAMRFVVAACAAFMVLMCDLDPSASRQASTFNSSVLQNNRASPLVPVVELFLASVQAIELANARAAHEETVEPPRAVESVAPAPVSPTERFCHALKEAAEASGIPVPF